MKDLSYSEILRKNKDLGRNLSLPIYEIAVLSNCTVSLLKDVLEYFLRTDGINTNVTIGDYDNIIQGTLKYEKSNLVIIFWELCNLIDGFHYKVEELNEGQLEEIYSKTTSEINLVFRNLQKTSLVMMNKFTSLPFSHVNPGVSNFERLARKLNTYLEGRIQNNIRLIDMDKILSCVGLKSSIDLRYYYSSKSLYTIELYKEYTNAVKPFVMAVNGKSKKALILDCDNTLWRGILGEDGKDGIEMSPLTTDGAIFSEIQSMVLNLAKQGILIGLCTKNNFKDVAEVIESHPDMQLRDKDITIKKINWKDKTENLQEIARELNIGLDSLVYVDDSPFEINLIKAQLSEVAVIQVPEKLHSYPRIIKENMGLFYSFSLTREDTQKAQMISSEIKRVNAQKEFPTIEDYLVSLGLKMSIFEDDETLIPRLSQLTHKTNQFNLTTKRYTETDIQNLIERETAKVYAFSVSDKFGDSGVTGLSIIQFDFKKQTADIDTFLMSCRIIGRNLEYAFMDYLVESVKETNTKLINARYIKTKKNELTQEFYEGCSFSLVNSADSVKNYTLEISRYRPKHINYVEIISGRQNQENHVYSV